jgi:hypothetical protein
VVPAQDLVEHDLVHGRHEGGADEGGREQ